MGNFNTATGHRALLSNTIGAENIGNRGGAMGEHTEGSFNAVIGVGALASNTTGTGNTAIGEAAGVHTTGNGNVCIGE